MMNESTSGKTNAHGNPNSLESLAADLVFGANKCSKTARKIVAIDHNLVIELWYNKHYYDRFYLGDEMGKRHGIDPDLVESLVTRAMGHLFWYSTVVGGFKFVNQGVGSETAQRVVLQEALNGSILNIVIEVHFLSINRFEVTVITAMVIDNFRIGSGQFYIEIKQDQSFLKKIDTGKVLDICSFPLV